MSELASNWKEVSTGLENSDSSEYALAPGYVLGPFQPRICHSGLCREIPQEGHGRTRVSVASKQTDCPLQ